MPEAGLLIRSSLGFSVLLKDTLTCRHGEPPQNMRLIDNLLYQPSSNHAGRKSVYGSSEQPRSKAGWKAGRPGEGRAAILVRITAHTFRKSFVGGIHNVALSFTHDTHICWRTSMTHLKCCISVLCAQPFKYPSLVPFGWNTWWAPSECLYVCLWNLVMRVGWQVLLSSLEV